MDMGLNTQVSRDGQCEGWGLQKIQQRRAIMAFSCWTQGVKGNSSWPPAMTVLGTQNFRAVRWHVCLFIYLLMTGHPRGHFLLLLVISQQSTLRFQAPNFRADRVSSFPRTGVFVFACFYESYYTALWLIHVTTKSQTFMVCVSGGVISWA